MKPKFTDTHRFVRRAYDPSHATDIRKRFEQIKREHQENEREACRKVVAHIERKKGNG